MLNVLAESLYYRRLFQLVLIILHGIISDFYLRRLFHLGRPTQALHKNRLWSCPELFFPENFLQIILQTVHSKYIFCHILRQSSQQNIGLLLSAPLCVAHLYPTVPRTFFKVGGICTPFPHFLWWRRPWFPDPRTLPARRRPWTT